MSWSTVVVLRLKDIGGDGSGQRDTSPNSRRRGTRLPAWRWRLASAAGKRRERKSAGRLHRCRHRQSAPVKATVLIPLPLVKPLPRRRPPIKSTTISFLLSPIPVHQLAPATRAADQASARERRDEEEKKSRSSAELSPRRRRPATRNHGAGGGGAARRRAEGALDGAVGAGVDLGVGTRVRGVGEGAGQGRAVEAGRHATLPAPGRRGRRQGQGRGRRRGGGGGGRGGPRGGGRRRPGGGARGGVRQLAQWRAPRARAQGAAARAHHRGAGGCDAMENLSTLVQLCLPQFCFPPFFFLSFSPPHPKPELRFRVCRWLGV